MQQLNLNLQMSPNSLEFVHSLRTINTLWENSNCYPLASTSRVMYNQTREVHCVGTICQFVKSCDLRWTCIRQEIINDEGD